jgi:hypothetical protein
MTALNHEPATQAAAPKGRDAAIGAMLLSVLVLAVMLPTAAGARSEAPTAKRVAAVATVTASDFRVAIVAARTSEGAAPTAEVRAAVAQRVGAAWRERRELRLAETYFWRTVTGPRAICRLEITTTTTSTSRPHVAIRLLRSPSLGCGPTHRLTLPSR